MSRLLPHGAIPERQTEDSLGQEKRARARVLVTVHVCSPCVVQHVTAHRKASHVPGTSECRRLYDGCVGFDVT